MFCAISLLFAIFVANSSVLKFLVFHIDFMNNIRCHKKSNIVESNIFLFKYDLLVSSVP